MTIHWGLFVPGIVLLLFPADRLLSSHVELRSFGSFQSLENSPRRRPWWWVPLLWIDPMRGFIGVFLLQHAMAATASSWDLMPKPGYTLLAGLMAVGVVSQTLTRRGDGDAILAPVGFVTGMTVALMPWPVALLTLMTAGLGAFALRQFHAFFSCGLVAVTLLGLLFEAEAMWVFIAIGCFVIPLIISLVKSCTLELPTRKDSGSVVSPAGHVSTPRHPLSSTDNDHMGKLDEPPSAGG